MIAVQPLARLRRLATHAAELPVLSDPLQVVEGVERGHVRGALRRWPPLAAGRALAQAKGVLRAALDAAADALASPNTRGHLGHGPEVQNLLAHPQRGDLAVALLQFDANGLAAEVFGRAQGRARPHV